MVANRGRRGEEGKRNRCMMMETDKLGENG